MQVAFGLGNGSIDGGHGYGLRVAANDGHRLVMQVGIKFVDGQEHGGRNEKRKVKN